MIENNLLRESILRDAVCVGAAPHVGFDAMTVISDASLLTDTGPVPRGSYLLATTIDPTDPDRDQPGLPYVVMLRVDGVGRPSDAANARAVRENIARQGLTGGRGVDPATQQLLQQQTWECTVVGTFYVRADDAVAEPSVSFGADLPSLPAATMLRVYKPTGAGLEWIAGYYDPAERRNPAQVEIGEVRYTSTGWGATADDRTRVPVKVCMDDLIGEKTYLGGITRSGKSNSVKVLMTASWQHSQVTGQPLGQLLFDPNGEYANVNTQDGGTSLADLGTEHVVVYRYGATESDRDAGIRPLQVNFFDPDQLELAFGILASQITTKSADYVSRFLSADLLSGLPGCDGEEVDHRERMDASRGRLAFYATLDKARFRGARDVYVSMSGDLAAHLRSEGVDIDNHYTEAGTTSPFKVVKADHVRKCVDLILEGHKRAQKAGDHAEDGDGLCLDFVQASEAFQAVAALYQPQGGRSGATKLAPIREAFHSPVAATNYLDDVYDDLLRGRMAIVDLSRGMSSAVSTLADRLVDAIVDSHMAVFTGGMAPPAVQIVCEEAHNLFAASKSDRDPWVRLARESAKLNISLLYATQSPTAVDPFLLSQTANLFIGHVNDATEVGRISGRYDFGAYEGQTLRADDKGFLRVRTRSGKYVLPVQIRKFGPSMIADAKAAAAAAPSSTAPAADPSPSPSGATVADTAAMPARPGGFVVPAEG